MRRVIYCPDDSMLEEASILAARAKLPINVGEHEGIKDLVFNKNKVDILDIPEYRSVSFNPHIEKNFHQSIDYYNDFINLYENTFLYINDVKYLPLIVEKNKTRFAILENESGLKSCIIEVNGTVAERFSYEVY